MQRVLFLACLVASGRLATAFPPVNVVAPPSDISNQTNAALKTTPATTERLPDDESVNRHTKSQFSPAEKASSEEVASKATRSIRTHVERKLTLSTSLLTLSGVSESICFRRFKCFPNMMTGNTVRCMDALADGDWGMLGLYSSMISMYVLGGSLFKVVQFRTPQKSSTKENDKRLLSMIIRISVGLFLLSDLVGRQVNDLARMPVLALCYGMINAAGTSLVGTVTNAVTGHWTKIGVGNAEALLFIGNKPSEGYLTSLAGVGAFVGGLLGTNLVHNLIAATKPQVLSRLPPLGLSFAAAYTVLLTWYIRSERDTQ